MRGRVRPRTFFLESIDTAPRGHGTFLRCCLCLFEKHRARVCASSAGRSLPRHRSHFRRYLFRQYPVGVAAMSFVIALISCPLRQRGRHSASDCKRGEALISQPGGAKSARTYSTASTSARPSPRQWPTPVTTAWVGAPVAACSPGSHGGNKALCWTAMAASAMFIGNCGSTP